MLASVATVGSLGMVVAPPATAATGNLTQSDLTSACRLKEGTNGWTAHLEFPNQGGYGWRCWADLSAVRKGVDIENYCQYYYGLHARGGSTAYNWRCDT